jgi:acyl-CoA reductase-like NAD-dependent aldehyde dehydrogenase
VNEAPEQMVRPEYQDELPPYWPLWVNGREAAPEQDDRFDVFDPSTGERLCEVARAREPDVAKAVAAAAAALPSWAARSVADRRQILFDAARLLLKPETTEELALLECLNTGKPIQEAKEDVLKTAAAFEFYGGLVDKLFGTTIPLSKDVLNYTVREPVGITAHISPWNYPLRLAFRSVVPALAGGNTVVLKPAEETPLTALRMATVLAEAGVPPGVFNVLPGFGSDAGAALTADPRINHISFTGSVETGIRVMQQAARNVVPVTLELGGKSPHVIFADADLDQALESVVKAMFTNAGQVCFAATRLFVQDKIYDAFVERCIARTKKIRVGPGRQNPDMGPLISERQRQSVMNYIALGQEEGGEVLLGGRRPSDAACQRGYFLEPTLMSGTSNQSRVCQEEIFGPVLTILRFSSTEEAIRLANDTEYGLAAGVWTTNINCALRMAAEIKAGQVFINNYAGGSVATPFGGCKRSGFGRERGVEAMQHYTQVKSVVIRIRS